jgi:hypothetical protein
MFMYQSPEDFPNKVETEKEITQAHIECFQSAVAMLDALMSTAAVPEGADVAAREEALEAVKGDINAVLEATVNRDELPAVRSVAWPLLEMLPSDRERFLKPGYFESITQGTGGSLFESHSTEVLNTLFGLVTAESESPAGSSVSGEEESLLQEAV